MFATISNLDPVNDLEFILRILGALIIGIIIGGEREAKEKPAGLRTNTLVSLGSALFVLLPIELGMAIKTPDTLARILSGIISGVGFIGAGTILRDKTERVRGLTSASAIWVSASLGIAVGCGLWLFAFIGTIAVWSVLRLFKKIEHFL